MHNCSVICSSLVKNQSNLHVFNRVKLFNNLKTTNSALILKTTIFFVLFSNLAFFSNTLKHYPLNSDNFDFLFSLIFVSSSLIIFILSLVCFKYTTKPVLIVTLLLTSVTSYFMDNYNIIIDDSMIKYLLSRNSSDSINVLSAEMVVYLVLLGILPSVVVYKTELVYQSFKKELLNAIKSMTMSLATIIVVIVLLGDFYALFFREHAEIRSYSNPTTFIYSSVKYFSQTSTDSELPFKTIALDAKIETFNDK